MTKPQILLDGEDVPTVIKALGQHPIAARIARDFADDSSTSSKRFRRAARTEYHVDGEIEIDDRAPVSELDSGGAWVNAWVFVTAPAEGDDHD